MSTVLAQPTTRPVFAMPIAMPSEKPSTQLAVPAIAGKSALDAITMAGNQQARFNKSTRYHGLLASYIDGGSPVAHERIILGFTGACGVTPGVLALLAGWGMGDCIGAALLGGGLAAVGGFIVSNIALCGGTALLETITKRRTLTKENLAFFTSASAKATTPLDKAVLGQLAERWLTCLDRRQILGGEVRRALRNAIATASELPEDVQESAKRVAGVMDNLYNQRNGGCGLPKSSFSSSDVSRLISAIEGLTDDERPGVIDYMREALFKDEKPRLKFDDFQSMVELQAVLTDGYAPRPLPPPPSPPKH